MNALDVKFRNRELSPKFGITGRVDCETCMVVVRWIYSEISMKDAAKRGGGTHPMLLAVTWILVGHVHYAQTVDSFKHFTDRSNLICGNDSNLSNLQKYIRQRKIKKN